MQPAFIRLLGSLRHLALALTVRSRTDLLPPPRTLTHRHTQHPPTHTYTHTSLLYSMPRWNYNQLPDLTEKVALVTGASAGLGKKTSLELARKGAHVFMVGRSLEKTQRVVEEIQKETGNQKVEFLQADLMSLKSVDEAAQQFLKRSLPLHILVNNAGIMAVPFALSADGIESQMATNHLAHFLLTKLLLPVLEQSAPSRIVCLSSVAHEQAPKKGGILFDKMNDQASYSPWSRYGETKLANLLMARHLAKLLKERKVDNVYVNAVHPGVVKTDLFVNAKYMTSGILRSLFSVFQISVDEGALTQVFVAGAPEIETNAYRGRYFVPYCKEANSTANGKNEALAQQLWEWSEKVVTEKLGTQ